VPASLPLPNDLLSWLNFVIFKRVDESFEFIFVESVEDEVIREGVKEEFDIVVGLGVDWSNEVACDFLGGGENVVETLGLFFA